MKKYAPFALLMLCIVALMSCSGTFVTQKKVPISITLDTDALLKSMKETNNEQSRSAINAFLSRQVGIDEDAGLFKLQATLTAGTEIQEITQTFNNENKKIQLQFANVPIGSSASIVIEVYATEGSTKYILFEGRGEINSVKAGENAVSIKMKNPNLEIASIIMLPNFTDDPTSIVEMKFRTSMNSPPQTVVTYSVMPYTDEEKPLSNFAFDDARNVYYAYTTKNTSVSPESYQSTLVKISAQTQTLETFTPLSDILITSVATSKDRLYFTYTNYTNPSSPTQHMAFLSLADTSSYYWDLSLHPTTLESISALAVVQESSGIDNIYIAGRDNSGNDDCNKIWKYQINTESIISKVAEISYTKFLNESELASIVSDMIFFDGSLMLLVNQMDPIFSRSDYHSRGKLVAINPSTMEYTDYGASEDPHPTAEDPQDAFLGPIRFIGVMPKKLFIADDGAYATAYDDIRQKNRIVTFDSASETLSVNNVDVEFFYKVTGVEWNP